MALLLLAAMTGPALAYYDDIHYAYTYFVARQAGYTALQAQRVATACVSVDYDPETEPVQAPTAGSILREVADKIPGVVSVVPGAQVPRWKFHAFHNAEEFEHAVGREREAMTAAGAIGAQRRVLWQQAIEEEYSNPGVFLHFFQDEVPHAGYGSDSGHWPVTGPEEFARHAKENLPIGGTTDWASFRNEGVTFTLAAETHEWLRKYAATNSPHQIIRPFKQSEHLFVVRELMRVNQSPLPFRNEQERQLFGRYYAYYFNSPTLGLIMRHVAQADGNEHILAKLAAELSSADAPNLHAQMLGPSLTTAVHAVNAALERAGFTDRLGVEHAHYDFDSDGRLAEESMRDEWTLNGNLSLTLKEKVNGQEVEIKEGTATARLAKSRASDDEYALGPPQRIGAGGRVRFAKMPVGRLVIEAAGPDGRLKGRKGITLDRVELDTDLVLEPVPLTKAVSYRGLAAYGTRIWQPGEARSSKLFNGKEQNRNTSLESASFLVINPDGTVTGEVRRAIKYEPLTIPGQSVVRERFVLRGKLAIPASDLKQPTRGKIVATGKYAFAATREPPIVEDEPGNPGGAWMAILFCGDDVSIAHYPQFARNFIVLYDGIGKLHQPHNEQLLNGLPVNDFNPAGTIAGGTLGVVVPEAP